MSEPPSTEPARLEAHSLGGQAVIEGVMMRSPAWWAIAVRRPEGTIHTESHRVGAYLDKRPKLGKALIRGVLALGEAMSIGVRALAISARHSSGDEEPVSEREIATAIGLAFLLFIGLFIVLPALLIRGGGGSGGLFVIEPGLVVHNLIEGGVRIGILVAYIVGISFLRDVKRVFQYHGAEHKVIAAYEQGSPRTVEGARPFSTIHLRCGTNFLFLLMLLAVVVFSFVGRSPWWWRIASRIVLLPVVAAFSYEVLRFAARHEGNPVIRVLTWPGLFLQRITTRPPADEQLEVAVAALDELIERYEGPDGSPETPSGETPDVDADGRAPPPGDATDV